MKKIIIGLLVGLSLFVGVSSARAEGSVVVNFFRADGCPHCAAEEEYLQKLSESKDFELREFEVSKNQANGELFVKVLSEIGLDRAGVPVTIVGNKYVSGYLNEETTGVAIVKMIDDCGAENECIDVVAEIKDGKKIEEVVGKTNGDICATGEDCKAGEAPKLELPVFGSINLAEVSLPVLTVMVGLVDGFNPCAMWTLLFLISLLLGMHDRRKMWILGGAFIATSAAIYFLFMAAWLQLFLLLGMVIWIRLIIGGVALGAGGLNVRQYFKDREGGCVAEKSETREKVFDRLQRIIKNPSFLLALLGIMGLAVAVNVVELVCSAGLPAVYTQILAMNNLPMWKYFSYLLLYVLIFMADDILVFVMAMVTMEMMGIESKYARYSHLVGGVIMVIIGILLWFRPEWLMFG